MQIIIVDDDRLVALSLKTILEADPSITVTATGQDGADAIALYRKYHPDVLLMDIQMKSMSGLQAAEEIKKQDKEARILFLTTFSDDEYIVKALQVALGLNNREIAEQLYLSEGTVRNYISTILDKLSLRDRTQLAVFYYQKVKR